MKKQDAQICSVVALFITIIFGPMLAFWAVYTSSDSTLNPWVIPDIQKDQSVINPWLYGQWWGVSLDMLVGSALTLLVLYAIATWFYRFVNPTASRLGLGYSFVVVTTTITAVMLSGQAWYYLQEIGFLNIDDGYDKEFWAACYVTYLPGVLAALLVGIGSFRLLRRHRPTINRWLSRTPLNKWFRFEVIDTSAKQLTVDGIVGQRDGRREQLRLRSLGEDDERSA